MEFHTSHSVLYAHVALLFRMLSVSQIGILFQATDLRTFFHRRKKLNKLAAER